MMGLKYPGGPLIDNYAKDGNPNKFKFSKTNVPGLDFSFSGIKTAFLYFLRDQEAIDSGFVEKNLPDLCASIQRHLIEMLMDKLVLASKETKIKEVGIAGGVSANRGLRQRLMEISEVQEWNIFIPDFQYCTDNAGMIAMAAHFMFNEGIFETLDSVPEPRLTF